MAIFDCVCLYLLCLNVTELQHRQGSSLDLEPYLKKLKNVQRLAVIVNNVLQYAQVGVNETFALFEFILLLISCTMLYRWKTKEKLLQTVNENAFSVHVSHCPGSVFVWQHCSTLSRCPSCPEIPDIPEISKLSWNCPEIRNCPEILVIW